MIKPAAVPLPLPIPFILFSVKQGVIRVRNDYLLFV